MHVIFSIYNYLALPLHSWARVEELNIDPPGLINFILLEERLNSRVSVVLDVATGLYLSLSILPNYNLHHLIP